MNKEYFKIGKLAATYGLAGELVLQHKLGKTDIKGLEAIFIEEKNDAFLPYFIESARLKSDTELWLKLEGISTKEKAQLLRNKEVWLSEKDFKKYAVKSAPISLLGFTMINSEDDKVLGIVEEVIEQPHQVLCRLLINNKEAYIPIHAETLDEIDHKQKKVYVTLPQGLLEIYI